MILKVESKILRYCLIKLLFDNLKEKMVLVGEDGIYNIKYVERQYPPSTRNKVVNDKMEIEKLPIKQPDLKEITGKVIGILSNEKNHNNTDYPSIVIIVDCSDNYKSDIRHIDSRLIRDIDLYVEEEPIPEPTEPEPTDPEEPEPVEPEEPTDPKEPDIEEPKEPSIFELTDLDILKKLNILFNKRPEI